jgi:hypothetical protein
MVTTRMEGVGYESRKLGVGGGGMVRGCVGHEDDILEEAAGPRVPMGLTFGVLGRSNDVLRIWNRTQVT